MTQQPRTPKQPRTSRPEPRHAARLLALVLALTLAFAVTGCGSSGSGHVHFAKTKFVLHAGLAFGAFHRYIYKPYKAGDFAPVSSHKLTLVKAGAAGLFAYHEIKIALVDAQSSPTLSKLVRPLTLSKRSCTHWARAYMAASSTGARSARRTPQ